MRTTRRAQAAQETVADVSPAHVRKWAKSMGIPVAQRGRVPHELIERYRNRSSDEVVAPDKEEHDLKGQYIVAPEERALPTGKTNRRRSKCGFCATTPPTCRLCPGQVKNGSEAPKPLWTCVCFERNPDPQVHERARTY